MFKDVSFLKRQIVFNCSLVLRMYLLSMSTCGGDDPSETSTGSWSAHWKNLHTFFFLLQVMDSSEILRLLMSQRPYVCNKASVHLLVLCIQV